MNVISVFYHSLALHCQSYCLLLYDRGSRLIYSFLCNISCKREDIIDVTYCH